MTSAANLSIDEIMELHINTLYCCDAAGRLRCVNEVGEPPAPFFYMGRTLEGNFWRFRYDLPAAVIEKLDRLCRSEPIATDLSSQPQNYAAIHAVINESAPQQKHPEYQGPAYWIPGGNELAANVVLISEGNVSLLPNEFAWMLPLSQSKEIEPIAAAVEQNQAVAICFCSRRPAQATEAGVETLAAFRGKGYATATVAAWAAEVSKRGCIPMYSTSWDNLASQAVARKLQMVMYGADWSIR
jgi:hypothetical protein